MSLSLHMSFFLVHSPLHALVVDLAMFLSNARQLPQFKKPQALDATPPKLAAKDALSITLMAQKTSLVLMSLEKDFLRSLSYCARIN